MKPRGEEKQPQQQRILIFGNVLKATRSQDSSNWWFLWLACVNYNATFDAAQREFLINCVNEALCALRDFNSLPADGAALISSDRLSS